MLNTASIPVISRVPLTLPVKPAWAVRSNRLFVTCNILIRSFFLAIFNTNTGSGSPVSWIVGDAFMKNVYTVFRQNPAGVGFATVKESNGGASSTGRPTQTAPSTTKSHSLSLPFPTHFGSGTAPTHPIHHGLVGVVGSLIAVVIGVMILL